MITATGGAVPYLAESVTPNADYSVWTITLRQGISFHDGTPLNGEALYRNVDAVYKSALTGIALKPLIASYAQSGPYSVSVTMVRPWVTFPYTLAEQQVCFVAAPSMLDAPNGGTDNPIGTGPFKFQDWVVNDHFTSTANPHYWRPGQPYLSSITFKPIPDAGARAEALQAGDVDLIHLSEPQQILQFRGDKSYAYLDNSGKMVGAPNVNCLMLNCAKPPFDDIDARRAVAYGTNRIQYAHVIDQNVNAPATGIYQPGSPYYTKTTYPPYNATQARALVKKVRQKTGKPFTFTMNSVAAPYESRIAAYTQQQMQNIGITVNTVPMEQNELINDALAGSFEATEWNQFGGMSPDLNYVWFSTKTATPSGVSINMARNVDPRIEEAFTTGMTTPTRPPGSRRSRRSTSTWPRTSPTSGPTGSCGRWRPSPRSRTGTTRRRPTGPRGWATTRACSGSTTSGSREGASAGPGGEGDPEAVALSYEEAVARLTAPGQVFELTDVTVRGVDYRSFVHAPPTLRAVFTGAAVTGSGPSWSTRASGGASSGSWPRPTHWRRRWPGTSGWPRGTGWPSPCATSPSGWWPSAPSRRSGRCRVAQRLVERGRAVLRMEDSGTSVLVADPSGPTVPRALRPSGHSGRRGPGRIPDAGGARCRRHRGGSGGRAAVHAWADVVVPAAVRR